MNIRNRSFGYASGLFISLSLQTAIGQDSKPVTSLNEATKKLKTAQEARKKDATLETRIRESTWRLLVGELAADKSVGLSSNAYDALTRGISELDEMMTELEQTPDLEKKLSEQPQLAMRFDAAVARRTEAVAKKDLSRADELARLSQLRELNRAYRTLIRHLISAQTEALLGEADATTKSGEEATKQLKLAEEIVGKRRDFYLFEDEPAVEAADAELKLVQEAAVPYADEAGRHQRAILGLTLCRLAIQADPPSKELLEAGVAQAEFALADAKLPSPIALYAQGLGSLELGRLLTRNEPYSEQTHTSATDLFQKSQDALTSARKAIPEALKLAVLRTELDRLIAEGDSVKLFLEQSQELQQRGDFVATAAVLNRGSTRHRSRELALAAIDNQWRSGAAAAEVDATLKKIVDAGLVTETDPDYRLLRGQIGVLGVWNILTADEDAKNVDEQRDKLLEQLTTALADLKAIPMDTSEGIRLPADAVAALGESAAILLDKSRTTTEAALALKQIPMTVAELEKVTKGQTPREQQRFLEAIQFARLAEGYLSLRLSPEYQDRARSAFASAADAGAKLSKGAIGIRPAGSAILRALLFRDGASSDRLAQEERQLRISLQKMLPALAAMPVSDPKAIATTLVAAQRSARSAEPSWDARTQLDVRDTAGARNGLLADSRAVTAIALVSAQQSELALKELLTELWPALKSDDLAALDWKDVQEKSKVIDDPLTVYALGLAAEDFAITKLAADSPLRKSLLKQALGLFDQASVSLSATAAWRERWPYLLDLVQAGHDRLISDEADIRRAKVLKDELRLTDVRQLLEQTRKRHPESTKVRHVLALSLIDEAQLSSETGPALLTQASDLLEEMHQQEKVLPTETVLLLAEMRERTGKRAEAVAAYREVVDRTSHPTEKLKARSRMTALQFRTGD